jgi:peptidoglycan-associated lipoprotein
MMKKTMTVLLILGFAFSMLLFTSSCAKKQIGGEEKVTGAPAKAPAEEDVAHRYTGKGVGKAAEEEAMMDDGAKTRLRIEKQAFEAENIYFDFDRSELKPEARAILTKKAAWLRSHPQFNVVIEGNCDERGTNEYNLALGERRATAAWKFLNNLGISGNRMTTVSYGEERPAFMGHNERAWAKNRRDEFKLK